MTALTYDVVAVADNRFPGGTSAALCREIDGLRAGGLSVALAPVTAPGFPRDQPPQAELARRMADGSLPVIGPDVAVRCGLLVAHNPMIFEHALPRYGLLQATARLLVVHQAPVTGDGRLLYDPLKVDAMLRAAFGGDFLWIPTGPAGRANLAGCGCAVRIAEETWPLVVDAEAWGKPRNGLLGPVPVLGRHSRPDRLKWPTDPQDLRRAFPDRPDMKVRLMGFGAEIARETGPVPQNWEILPFGAITPAEFLHGIDFFVYHHHREWFETFGLTIAEAMASGAVAVLDPDLRPTFGDAAVYAAPGDVIAIVERLSGDPAAYARQSAAGWSWVKETMSPERLVATAHHLLAAAGSAAGIDHDATVRTADGDRRRVRLARRRWLQIGAGLVRALPGGETLVRAVRRLA